MKTTLELTYEELLLIGQMCNKYIDKLDYSISISKECGVSHDYEDKMRKQTFGLWAKIEKAQKEVK